MNVDEEVRRTVQELGKRERAPRVVRTNGEQSAATAAERERYDFVRLGEKIAESLIRAAEDQVTEATNNLERVKVFSEGVRTEIAARSRELADMNARLKIFGASLLEAHQKYLEAEQAEAEKAKPV